ncbi:MAG: hypothetical protein IPK25_15880 [Saprospiraceae bacterium]|nr:hypothetical protein [Saprospiraceae bacterium]
MENYLNWNIKVRSYPDGGSFTYLLNGTCDSIWTNPCNWVGNSVPDSIHTVIISADAQHCPKLKTGSFSVGNGSGTQRCKKLILMYGGCLETDGIPVSISNRIQNSECPGSEEINPSFVNRKQK